MTYRLPTTVCFACKGWLQSICRFLYIGGGIDTMRRPLRYAMHVEIIEVGRSYLIGPPLCATFGGRVLAHSGPRVSIVSSILGSIKIC